MGVCRNFIHKCQNLEVINKFMAHSDNGILLSTEKARKETEKIERNKFIN